MPSIVEVVARQNLNDESHIVWSERVQGAVENLFKSSKSSYGEVVYYDLRSSAWMFREADLGSAHFSIFVERVEGFNFTSNWPPVSAIQLVYVMAFRVSHTRIGNHFPCGVLRYRRCIRTSNIMHPCAGVGAFAKSPFRRGEIIGYYYEFSIYENLARWHQPSRAYRSSSYPRRRNNSNMG